MQMSWSGVHAYPTWQRIDREFSTGFEAALKSGSDVENLANKDDYLSQKTKEKINNQASWHLY